MKIKGKFLILLLVFLILLFIYTSYIFYKNVIEHPKEVCIENKMCFIVEIANTPEEKRIGLSDRGNLEENNGLLFLFQEGEIPGFWMKDMKFPIDLLWIDENMKVVGIEKSMQPCGKNSCPLFYPERETMYVLEINSGLAENYDFEKGDFVYFRTILVYFFSLIFVLTTT